MQLYDYTIFKQDGTIENINGVKQKEFASKTNSKTGEKTVGLYELLKCQTIELIPVIYYADKKWGKCSVYGDEEGRFKEDNHTNPHFDSIIDVYGNKWDVVGDIVRERVHHD